MYWHIGKRIREDVLKGERADYGDQIVSTLSTQLIAEYGRGFSARSLFRMVRFAEAFPDELIVSSLMTQLSWTHFIYIIPIENPLEAFILELGSDFAFVARQKRMSVDAEDYYLDLLFYHRRLRRLVAIDLKLGRFQAADKGQMELYLRWLEANDQQPGEEPPIGLILCADKSDDHVTLLRLGAGPTGNLSLN